MRLGIRAKMLCVWIVGPSEGTPCPVGAAGEYPVHYQDRSHSDTQGTLQRGLPRVLWVPAAGGYPVSCGGRWKVPRVSCGRRWEVPRVSCARHPVPLYFLW